MSDLGPLAFALRILGASMPLQARGPVAAIGCRQLACGDHLWTLVVSGLVELYVILQQFNWRRQQLIEPQRVSHNEDALRFSSQSFRHGSTAVGGAFVQGVNERRHEARTLAISHSIYAWRPDGRPISATVCAGCETLLGCSWSGTRIQHHSVANRHGLWHWPHTRNRAGSDRTTWPEDGGTRTVCLASIAAMQG